MTAFDPLGLIDFNALHFRRAADEDIAVWAFDLLFHNGKDVRQLPLVERKDLLMILVAGAGDDRLRLSDWFDDGVELLAQEPRGAKDPALEEQPRSKWSVWTNVEQQKK